jgi:microcystin-dependent protein
MASTSFVNNTTLTDATWFNDVDTTVYGNLTSIAGTNTITGTGPSSMTGYASGQVFRFLPANSNTGATTLNISSLGAKSIYLNNSALTGGEITASCPVMVMYDGTRFHILASAVTATTMPTGALLDYAGTSAPTGWLGCDGSAVSRTTYANLFTAIGTTWGVGDGATTFNLPDFRRRVAVGSGGSGTATLANSVGSTGGAETHTLTSGELASHTHTGPSHTHSFSGTTSGQSADHTHNGYDTNNAYNASGGGDGINYQTYGAGSGTSNDHTHTYSGSTGAEGTGATGSAGSGTAHNNVQPSAVVLKIIKY